MSVLKLTLKAKIIIIFSIVLLALIPISYAWMTDLRHISTITEVDPPFTLKLSGENMENIASLNLSNIDISQKPGKHSLIFSVHGDHISTYDMQLSHTTNLPFIYKIYSLEIDDSGTYQYIDKEGITHKYKKSDTELNGTYLNLDASSGIANDNLKSEAYNTYTNVQKNAYPLYWLAKELLGFVDYYLLEISWDENILNNKETDLVYLIVEKNVKNNIKNN